MTRKRLPWRSILTAVLLVGLPVWSVTLRAAESAGHHEDGETPSAEVHAGASDEHEVDYDQPPLDFDAPLFVWTLLVFLTLIFAGRKLAWGPLIAALNSREARVMEAHAIAASARSEIEDLIQQHEARIAESYDEVKTIVAAAREEAEQVKGEIVAQAAAEARELQEQSVAEIQSAREEALGQLSGRVDEYTALATEHILGRALRN